MPKQTQQQCEHERDDLIGNRSPVARWCPN